MGDTVNGNHYKEVVRKVGIEEMFEGVDAMNVSKMDASGALGDSISSVNYEVDFTEPEIIWKSENRARPEAVEGIGGMAMSYGVHELEAVPIEIPKRAEVKTIRRLVPAYAKRQVNFMNDRLFKIFNKNVAVDHPSRAIISTGDARKSVLSEGSTTGKIVTGTRKAFTPDDIRAGVAKMDINSLFSNEPIYGLIDRVSLQDLYKDEEMKLFINTGKAHLFLDGEIKMLPLFGVNWFLRNDRDFISPALYGETTQATIDAALTGNNPLAKIDTEKNLKNLINAGSINAKSSGSILLWRKSAMSQCRGTITPYFDQPTATNKVYTISNTLEFGVNKDLGFSHIDESTEFGYSNKYVDCDTVTIVEQWVS